MNTFSVLADPNEPIDPTDIEFFTFTGLVPDAKVAVQKGSFEAEKYPATVSLLACSNQHGHFVTATNTGFLFGNTKALRKTFYNTEKGTTSTLEEDKVSVSLDKPVQQVRYSANEDQLLIATAGGQLLVYSVHDIQTNKEQVKPIHTYNLGKEIADLRPNPEALPNLTAILFKDQHCQIMDTTTGQTQCEIPLDNVTAICWSPKGKQIVCGKTDGSLQHFDIQGNSKDALSIPEPLAAGHGDEQENRYVQDVLWIENHIFLVLYARPRHQEEEDYVNDGYIINRKPTTGSTGPEYIRLAEITPIFSTEGRGNHFYMEIIRGLGKEIKHLVIIANAATAELSVVGETQDGVWSTWQLPENGLANLPLSEETSMDTYPLGLALDLTADEKLPPVDASENDIGVDPVPIFYYLNDEGHMGAHHCYNVELARRGGSYKSENQPSSTTTPTTSAAPPVSAFGTSAFGSAMESKSTGGSFADLLSGKAAPPATTATSTTSGGFGGFGSTGGGGGLPSFSNLGSVPKISSGFANTSSFNTAVKPSFGATTGFGSSTNDKPTSTFSTPQKQAETTEKKPSLFGSTPANETKSAFGSTSTLGGFGSLAKNTVPGATSFGSPSSLGSGTSFGSLAKNTVPGATTPKPFSSSSFGSSSFGSAVSSSSPAANTKTTPVPAPSLPASAATTKPTPAATTITKTTPATPTPTPTSVATTTPTPAPATTTTPTPAPATTTTPTPAPATTTTPTTPSLFKTPITPTATKPTSETPSASPKDTEKNPSPSTTTTTSPKPEPTAKEGMAKEYESLYIIVNQELEKLKQYAEKVSAVINANTSSFGPKTKESLASEGSWCLTDCAQLGSVSKELLTDAQKMKEELSRTENTLQDLVLSCKKSMDKKEDVAYLLKKDVDHHVVDIMDNRELDAEAKSNLKSLTSKTDVFGSTLDDLEYKFQENKRRSKICHDHQSGELSLYSLHRAVRDIERGMVRKSKEVAELEENFAHFKLNDSRRRAKRVAFACDDLSDTEDEQEPQITEASIQHATRYLRRYNFLDCVCEETSKRMPIETTLAQ